MRGSAAQNASTHGAGRYKLRSINFHACAKVLMGAKVICTKASATDSSHLKRLLDFAVLTKSTTMKITTKTDLRMPKINAKSKFHTTISTTRETSKAE